MGSASILFRREVVVWRLGFGVWPPPHFHGRDVGANQLQRIICGTSFVILRTLQCVCHLRNKIPLENGRALDTIAERPRF